METTDGRDEDILDKQVVETDFKYREESLKDAPTPSNNIKGSQQTPINTQLALINLFWENVFLILVPLLKLFHLRT